MPAKTILVPDTNVLIHCRLLSEVDLQTSVDAEISEVVIPLAVVDELDKLKHSDSNRTARRAKRWLKILEEASTTTGYEIRSGCKLRIIPDANDRVRPQLVDAEIVLRCIELARDEDVAIILLSEDLGMRLRAGTAFQGNPNLRVFKAPADLLPDETDPLEQENSDLRAQLTERAKSGVRIEVTFAGQSVLQPPPARVLGLPPNVAQLVESRVSQLPRIDPAPSSPLLGGNTMGEISYHPNDRQVARYKRDLHSWTASYRKWVEHQIEVMELDAVAVRLGALQLANTGGATAEDVELRMSIESFPELRFTSASNLDKEMIPAEPRPPTPPLGPYTDFRQILDFDYDFSGYDTEFWSLAEHDAVAIIQQVRPNGRPVLFDEVLCIIPRNNRDPITKGFSIRWEVLAANPEYRAEGTLHVKPPRTDQATV